MSGKGNGPVLPQPPLTVESLLPMALFMLTASPKEIQVWLLDSGFIQWSYDHSEILLGPFDSYKSLTLAAHTEAKRLLGIGKEQGNEGGAMTDMPALPVVL